MAEQTTSVRRRELRYEDLTGREKAAVLLMALGAEAAAQIAQAMRPDELEQITLEIARLESVPADVAQKVLEEWQKTEEAAFSLAEGGVAYARQILEEALGPEKAAVVLRRIETQLKESGGFSNLRHADPGQLTSVLRNEHPQTIALILAHLEPALVAEVLNQLDPQLGSTVLYRMARMDKVLPEVLQVVERSLGTDSALSLSHDMAVAGGPASVASVLNLIPGALEKELLEGIAQQDHELCEEIKSLMFVFEDIVKLDDKSIQRVLREVETRTLALALKAASDELKQRIRGVLSQRATNALEEEMEFIGPVRVRDVEAAQAEIVRTVRALEETGEVVIGGGTDDYIV